MENRPDEPAGDRGQIIIVTALVIAVTFVGLALVLNSGIYAENLSSRQTTDTDGALSFSLATNETVAEAYERTNAANASNATEARQNFTGIVDSWEASQRQRGAERGIGVEVERTAHVGWQLNQSTNTQFTDDDGGGENWMLVDGATDVGSFRMNVTQTELYDANDTWSNVNASFNLLVDDGSDDWKLYVFQNDSHVVVHEGAPGGYADSADLPSDTTCAVPESRTVIDFQSELLGTTDCPVLNFSDDVSEAVKIEYRNGSKVVGTYTLVVNGSNAAETGNFDAPGGGEPTAQTIIYSASYHSRYGRSDLAHSRSGRHMIREETYDS